MDLQEIERVLVRKRNVGRTRKFHKMTETEEGDSVSECGLIKAESPVKPVSKDYAEKFFEKCQRCDWE